MNGERKNRDVKWGGEKGHGWLQEKLSRGMRATQAGTGLSNACLHCGYLKVGPIY